uniref:Methyltransferase-like protein 15 n=1 Tax=Timema cristinae TaxID=61476 RepID=A0A7R9GPV5_TIMCR|nr:unnamed protein product [Timema cristinae]
MLNCSVEVSESQDLPCEILHVPVMVKEVLRSLQPCPGQVFIDMTFGAGGHSRKLLQSTPNIKLFVLDRDPFAHSLAYKLANEFPGQVTPLLGKFSELPQLLSAQGVRQNSIDGIMFDFGCSSMQFDIAERGFSISRDGPLDMRMDGNRFPNAPTAADILAHADEDDIARILRIYGEEKQSKKIARAIIEARYLFKRLETTHELKELVASVCETDQRTDKLQRPTHSATKTFQALRIFVNNEVNELNYGMLVSLAYLKTEGKLVTLTFHSLEDRIVKRHLSGNIIDNAINPLPLRYMSQALWHDREAVDKLLESNWESIYKHVLIPTMEEVDRNPRSRSAKLRAAIRVKSVSTCGLFVGGEDAPSIGFTPYRHHLKATATCVSCLHHRPRRRHAFATPHVAISVLGIGTVDVYSMETSPVSTERCWPEHLFLGLRYFQRQGLAVEHKERGQRHRHPEYSAVRASVFFCSSVFRVEGLRFSRRALYERNTAYYPPREQLDVCSRRYRELDRSLRGILDSDERLPASTADPRLPVPPDSTLVTHSTTKHSSQYWVVRRELERLLLGLCPQDLFVELLGQHGERSVCDEVSLSEVPLVIDVNISV